MTKMKRVQVLSKVALNLASLVNNPLENPKADPLDRVPLRSKSLTSALTKTCPMMATNSMMVVAKMRITMAALVTSLVNLP